MVAVLSVIIGSGGIIALGLKMRILLTGSHGFVGTHFREKTKLDAEIICCDKKLERGHKEAGELGEKVLQGVDTIIHLAAFISGDESWGKPSEYRFNNFDITCLLLDRAIRAGVKRFVFASSAAVYGNPLTPYGATKLMAENWLECYKDQIEIVRPRFFNIYGNGQNPAYAGVISKLMGCDELDTFTIYGDGRATRDFVYIDDIVSILDICAVSSEKTLFSKPFDVGTGKGTSINDLVPLFNVGKVKYAPSKKEIRSSVANNGLALKLLGSNFDGLKSGLMMMKNEDKKR